MQQQVIENRNLTEGLIVCTVVAQKCPYIRGVRPFIGQTGSQESVKWVNNKQKLDDSAFFRTQRINNNFGPYYIFSRVSHTNITDKRDSGAGADSG